MKKLISAAAITLLLLAGPSTADPSAVALEGALQGSAMAPSGGSIEVVSSGVNQYLKFSEQFALSTRPGKAEVRHVDAQTGATTFIGYLVSPRGYQIYEVPAGITIDQSDQIVLFSPENSQDLATADLLGE